MCVCDCLARLSRAAGHASEDVRDATSTNCVALDRDLRAGHSGVRGGGLCRVPRRRPAANKHTCARREVYSEWERSRSHDQRDCHAKGSNVGERVERQRGLTFTAGATGTGWNDARMAFACRNGGSLDGGRDGGRNGDVQHDMDLEKVRGNAPCDTGFERGGR